MTHSPREFNFILSELIILTDPIDLTWESRILLDRSGVDSMASQTFFWTSSSAAEIQLNFLEEFTQSQHSNIMYFWRETTGHRTLERIQRTTCKAKRDTCTWPRYERHNECITTNLLDSISGLAVKRNRKTVESIWWCSHPAHKPLHNRCCMARPTDRIKCKACDVVLIVIIIRLMLLGLCSTRCVT